MVVRLRWACWAVLGVMALPSPAPAQWPRHVLHSLFPTGGAPGSTVEITISGKEVELADALWFDDPGLKAEHVEKGKFRVSIPADASAGRHDVRFAGPLGVSNPRSFLVDPRPSSLEVEPNNLRGQASPLPTGSVAQGQVNGPADVDWFAFDAKAGDRWLIELDSSRLESRLDPLLKVFGPNGREIAVSPNPDGDGADADPLIDLSVPADGRYYAQVTDRAYGGSPDHVYRLSVHQQPRVDSIRPLAVEPGKPAELTLLGRLIGGTPLPSGLESRTVTVDIPADLSPDPTSPGARLVPSFAAGRGGFEYRLDTPSGKSNPILLGQAIAPVGVETEPNDESASPQKLVLPCDLTADFGRPGDVDVFRFDAKKGDEWRVEVLAERAGSAADASFLLQRVRDNGNVEDVTASEDMENPGLGGEFSTASLDPSVRWSVPEDGTYQVVVQDLYGSQRGSHRLFYRLVIRPESPGFRLFAVPDNVAEPEGLTLRAGGRAAFRVLVERREGFNRPVRVSATNLPSGVTCEPIVLGPGQHTGPLVLEATSQAAAALSRIQVIGEALSADRKEMIQTGAPPAVAGTVQEKGLPGGLVWAPAQPNQPALARAHCGLVLAVRPSAPFRVDCLQSEVVAAPGQDIILGFKVTRLPGFDEAVTITEEHLPPNAGGSEISIPKDKDSGDLKVTIPANVPLGTYTILGRGAGSYNLQKDPKVDKKDTIRALEPTRPIRVIIRRP